MSLNYQIDCLYRKYLESYLQQKNIRYTIKDEMDNNDKILFRIEVEKIINYNSKHYASLILQEFRVRNDKNISLEQFMNQYAQYIHQQRIQDLGRSQLNNHLQNRHFQINYDNLNQRIQQQGANQILCVLKEGQKVQKQYRESRFERMNKLKLTLQNLKVRLQAAKVNGNQTEEMTRVKTVIKNGMWGYLNRIEQSLAKLSQLKQ